MKVLHLDVVGGISGDMFMAALSGLPLDEAAWRATLARLDLPLDALSFETRQECGLLARVATFAWRGAAGGGRFEHIEDIRAAIVNAGLPAAVEAHALAMLESLVQAEAAAHGVPLEQVHFHELAGADLVIDLVGAAAAVDLLHPDFITCSPLPMGVGTVHTEHGELPLPAPAVLELLKGLPLAATDIPGETVTPTGAAIVSHFVKHFATFADGRVMAASCGAGQRRNHRRPNVLRALWVEAEGDPQDETLEQLETNIDNMNPEHYEAVVERLFEAGALDVWLTPVQMKKGRPAVLLGALARPGDAGRLTELLFLHTPTLGVRRLACRRRALRREPESRLTPYGKVLGKRIEGPDGGRWVPEYEELKRLAAATGLPLRVLSEALQGG